LNPEKKRFGKRWVTDGGENKMDQGMGDQHQFTLNVNQSMDHETLKEEGDEKTRLTL